MKQWNIKRLRDEHGITQLQMAKYIDIPFYSYQRKENGETPFRDFEMYRISVLFGLPMDKIFLFKNCNDIAVKQ